jgi:hypothetical protein
MYGWQTRHLRFMFQVDSFEVEVAQEVTQLFPKFRCNPWGDSVDRAQGS